jgi:beta-N-acetylhexosaminidase
MSREILDGILRKRLGFKGLVVSDDMQMKAIADHFGFDDAIIRAAAAGVDLFWVCHNHDLQHRAIDAIIAGAESGAIPMRRLEEASKHQNAVFARFVKPAGRAPIPGVIGCAEHQAIAERVRRLADELGEGDDPTEMFVRAQANPAPAAAAKGVTDLSA